MPIKSKFVRFIFVLSLTLFLTVFAFADTIRLKDGSIIKGKIISFDGGTFVVLIGDDVNQRRLTYRADEIESIKFDSEPMPVSNVKTSSRIPDNLSTEVYDDGNTKIITVGQNKSKNTDPPIKNIPDNNETAKAKPVVPPITLNVSVMADDTANGWTNSGWVVRKGQRIRITGKGRISLGNGRYSTPGGISTLPDDNKLEKEEPTGGLIAVIGDDNNDFIFIGDSNEFIAERDGNLFLGVNEGNLSDNSGSFDVTIEIDPMIGN
jgi:hypothetical protein